MPRRDEEKKRRRQKRLQKRQQHQRPDPVNDPGLEELRRLQEMLRTAPPATFPGGCDPSLARPDLIKFDLANRATKQEPGRSKYLHMQDAAARGLLADLPELADDWVVEEFFWHGVPGDAWHPVDAYLAQVGDRFPPAAAEQLRLWKSAEIGLFEVGEVRDDLVTLEAWDPVQESYCGYPLRAVSLSLGGAEAYRQCKGAVTLVYLAPWVPADNLYCAMGYGKSLPKTHVAQLVQYLGLRHPEIVCRPLPWNLNRPAANEYLRQWRQREWQSWLGERLRFPFWAMVATPPDGKIEVRQVTELLPATPQRAQHLGIYLAVLNEELLLAAGATHVKPIEVASPNALPLAEYRAYREQVGPPPGTQGMPAFMERP